MTRAACRYGTAVGRAGWAGLVSAVLPPGVTAADGDDGAESPTSFRATTVNVTGVLAKPTTEHVVAPDV